MAAKKAPAKKMAAPAKASPKKADGGTYMVVNGKKVYITEAQLKSMAKGNRNRTDAAGRSGFGETATSNVRFKGGSNLSSANKSAIAAGEKAMRSGGDYQAAYIKSMAGAGKAAYVDAPALRKKAAARAAAEAKAKKKK
jgi:hypothetical protein